MTKILSLEGGGVWGLIEARALAKLFPDLTGRQVLERFDMAIGTSTGAIVLAALAADMTPRAIASLFLREEARRTLFVRRTGLGGLLGRLGVAPKWSSSGKLAGIHAALGPAGDTPLNALPLKTRLVLVSYDVDRNRDVPYSSTDSDVPLAVAAHASSSAPVLYFDRAARWEGARLWDGGVSGLTCPAMAGVAEAYGAGLSGPVSVLSIGTGAQWRPRGPAPAGTDSRLFQPDHSGNEVRDVVAMAKAVLGDPPTVAPWHAYAATGGRLVQMSPLFAPLPSEDGGWRLPAAYLEIANGEDPLKAFETLLSMDMDEMAQDRIEMIDRAATAWLSDGIPNQPVRMDDTTGSTLAGHRWFSEARQAWRGLTA